MQAQVMGTSIKMDFLSAGTVRCDDVTKLQASLLSLQNWSPGVLSDRGLSQWPCAQILWSCVQQNYEAWGEKNGSDNNDTVDVWLRSVLKTWGLPQETQEMLRRTNLCIGIQWFTKLSTQPAAPRLIKWLMSGLPLLTTSGQLARQKHFQLDSKWEQAAQTRWQGSGKYVLHLLPAKGRIMEDAMALDQISSFPKQDVEVLNVKENAQ